MSGPRFGVWAPVYGNHGARLHPEDLPDAGYRRTRDLLVHAESRGYDATLVAQHVIHPSDTENDVLETWSTLAGLAEATDRIELIGAIKPLLFNPLVFAKIAANIADISGGRLSINVVTGWFLPELEALGIDPLAHDDRYAYTRDWLDTVTDLWSGKHVAIGERGGQQALVRPVPKHVPPVYVGGESEPGRELGASRGDVYFINGRPLADTTALIEDLRARPRDRGPLRFGLSAFVIARPTEAEAKAEQAHLQSLIDAESRPEISSGTDPNTAMYQVLAGTRRIGSNGGTLAGLVGSYEQVIDRIDAFHAAGIELFMLQFQPIESELDRFADHIIGHYR
ncbi:LLM class flavin-dependent oxidoreductase [Mycobacterium sp. shizuoka-1]|uniref:LLM class flavin-dependent oxidoreductase n=1 Tax=Mycobacterium sp. shizuoka-1 TaxID=2039281 RepID=UPI000C05DF3E|nr:LLM class flavin-dependent oxidoreductase [Mycobacterium sp. shizuoka-1]GAY17107.1 monooxygenase [Mycobacterium sp. shizuoka-1]